MIRVYHIITGLSVGGAEMMLYKLLSRIDRSRFACEVVSLTTLGPVAERISALGIPVRALELNHPLKAPQALLQLVRWMKKSRPHVVQTWLYHADLFGGIAAVAGGAPVAWGIRHGDINSKDNKRSVRQIAKVCALLSRYLPRKIICCSEVSREAHSAFGYADSKMLTIPNGFDLETFTPDPMARASVRNELGLAEDTLLIGLVGRFDPLKDHQNFVAAAKWLHAHAPDVHFLLCGRGISNENPELVRWIQDADLQHCFHLLGARSDMPRLTAAFDVAVSSSLTEGFSNTIGEAMACAIPCAVTAVGDSSFIVKDTGRMAPPCDPVALGSAILELVEMGREGRERLGKAARERVESHFSLPTIVNRYESLYEDLANHVRN